MFPHRRFNSSTGRTTCFIIYIPRHNVYHAWPNRSKSKLKIILILLCNGGNIEHLLTLIFLTTFQCTLDDDAGQPLTLLVPRGWVVTWHNHLIVQKHEHGTSSAFSQPTTPPETIVFIEFLMSCPQYLFTVFSQSNCSSKLLTNQNKANIYSAASCACLFLVDFFLILSHLPFLA